MIKHKNAKINEHYWAYRLPTEVNGTTEILVVLKCKDGYQVCGAWECGIGDKQIVLIRKIRKPKVLEGNRLLYGEYDDG